MKHDFDAVIALGTNIGDKLDNLGHATALLEARRDVDIVCRSKLYRTAPWGVEDQDWFLNACLAVRTTLTPEALLSVCQGIEHEMGRERLKRWGPRNIDLDILVFGDVEQNTPELTLPHPRITERAFVLAPLHDIAPDLAIKGRRIADWLADIDRSGVTIYEPPRSQKN